MITGSTPSQCEFLRSTPLDRRRGTAFRDAACDRKRNEHQFHACARGLGPLLPDHVHQVREHDEQQQQRQPLRDKTQHERPAESA